MDGPGAGGNMLTVPIVRRLGLGVGMSLWGGTSVVTSFTLGALGLPGIQRGRAPISSPSLSRSGQGLGAV